MKSWHGNAFRVTGSLFGESTGDGGFPPTKNQCCRIFMYLWCFSELFNKHASGRWIVTPCRLCDIAVMFFRPFCHPWNMHMISVGLGLVALPILVDSFDIVICFSSNGAIGIWLPHCQWSNVVQFKKSNSSKAQWNTVNLQKVNNG